MEFLTRSRVSSPLVLLVNLLLHSRFGTIAGSMPPPRRLCRGKFHIFVRCFHVMTSWLFLNLTARLCCYHSVLKTSRLFHIVGSDALGLTHASSHLAGGLLFFVSEEFYGFPPVFKTLAPARAAMITLDFLREGRGFCLYLGSRISV